MADYKTNSGWMIAIAIIALLFVMQPGGPAATKDNVNNVVNSVQNSLSGGSSTAPGTNAGSDFIAVRYYDKDGNLIKAPGTYSIVNNIPGVSFIDVTITLTNIGTKPLTCDLASLGPTALDSALTKTQKIATVGGKAAWTSSLISVAQFENPSTPTTFSGTARCSYNNGVQVITLPDKTGNLLVNIVPDVGGADFTVSINTGGTGTEYCGDGTCQVSESFSTCPQDCAVATYAKFRTSDLSYVSGSAIAFSSTCGSTLTAYGYTTSSSSSGGAAINCTYNTAGVWTQVMSGLPGTWNTGYNAPSLWTKNSDPTTVRLCQDKAASTTVYYKQYSSSDADASKVDTSKTAINSAEEIAC